MKCYIGAKIVTAEPEPHADGRPGYRVVYPDGYASWSPQDTFEIAYREVTFHEKQLMVQTDAEHQISAISDGNPDHCDHDWSVDDGTPGAADQAVCLKCGITRPT